MTGKMLLIFFCWILLSLPVKGAATFCRVGWMSQAPEINGVIDEQEWSMAAKTGQFSDASNGRLASSPTELYIGYDQNNLFFAFRATIDFEPVIEPVKHDNLNILNVDAVRLSIIPPGSKTWMKFTVERGGGSSDMRVAGQVRQPAQEWEPEWRYAVKRTPLTYFAASIWEGEIAIPWTSLEMPPPKPGTTIPFQFTRYAGNIQRTAELNQRVSTWAPVSNLWHVIVPETFGKLIFAGQAPVFRFEKYGKFMEGEAGLSGVFSKPVADAEFEGRVWHLQNYQHVLARHQQKLPSFDQRYSWLPQLDIKKKTPMMMNWRFSDQHGKLAGGQIVTEASPLFQVEAVPLYSQNKVQIIGNLSKLNIKEGMRIHCRLLSENGDELEMQQISLQEGTRFFEGALPLGKLPTDTTGKVMVQLLDGEGRMQHYETDIKNLPRPEWMNQNIGAVNSPPPGWETPVIRKQEQSLDFHILDNRYGFAAISPFPQQIDLRGAPFSDGAMTLHLETEAGGKQTLPPSGKMRTASEDARGITLIWDGASKEVSLQAKVRIEFDGLAWYELRLVPLQKDVVIRKLSVEFPLRREYLRYMRGCNVTGMLTTPKYFALIGPAKSKYPLPQPDLAQPNLVSGEGWKFGKSFVNFLWVGGEDRGMYLVLPSQFNMHISDRYTETIDNDGEFSLRLHLIDTPTPMQRPLDYQLGTILTPCKRPRNVARLQRIGSGFVNLQEDGSRLLQQKPEMYAPFGKRFFHDPEYRPFEKDYFTTAILTCWQLPQVQNGNPTPPEKELKRIDVEVNAIRNSIGGMPMLWYDSLFTMFHLPQAIPYVYEWECHPRTRLPVEQLGTFVCATDAWADYYLYGVKKRMQQGIKCFYMDMSNFHSCSNRFHGCGKRNPDTGEVIPSIRFLDGREMFLRYQKLVKENDPEGLLVMHTPLCTPLALWVDVITDGEGWTNAPNYSSLKPEFYQMVAMGTKATGTVCNFFPGLILTHYQQAAKCDVTLAEVCGLTFSHNESMWNGSQVQLAGLRMVWDVLVNFGAYENNTEWVPYWRHPQSQYPGGVIISEWRRDKQRLLLVFNPYYEAQTCRLEIPQGYEITNALDKKPWTTRSAQIASRDFKLLLVQPQ
ncbi:MAG: hypothetical protein GX946_09190 [Oligosphaeraceae bacterium]|nr:hypothetical protein [Oligosphaeraceae bacterium]